MLILQRETAVLPCVVVLLLALLPVAGSNPRAARRVHAVCTALTVCRWRAATLVQHADSVGERGCGESSQLHDRICRMLLDTE